MRASTFARGAKSVLAISLLVITACGGSEAKVNEASNGTGTPAPSASSSAQAAADKPEPEEPFPTACAKEGSETCVPPASFVKKLCEAASPDMALALFAKGTPWVRGYLARATEAWDASGGPSSSDKLELDEEVLILVKRAPNTGGMIVSGAGGSYDVLRWDGKCASLQAEEVRMRLPPEPGNALIHWRRLDNEVQELLLKDEKIATKVGDQKRECKGVSAGQSNPKCDKAQKKLNRAIAGYVRRGGSLPAPPKLH
jgi:hypothetical protein